VIKLNLLPQYVIEARRIRVVVILFLVLLGLEGGIIYKAYIDLQAQETWFTNDKNYFTDRTKMIQGKKQERDLWKGKKDIYRPYIDFFTRNAIIQYNEGIAAAIEEAANTVGSGQTWFDSLSVTKDGQATATGHIVGMLNFLDYYFKMKPKGFTLVPQARPAPSYARDKWTLNDELPILVSGKITRTFPAKPTIPGETPVTPDKLYIPWGGTAAPAGGGTAAPAGGRAASPPAGGGGSGR